MSLQLSGDGVVTGLDSVASSDLGTVLGSKLDLAGGKILQTVTNVFSTETIISSTSYTDTGLTASITPSSATSKVLVIVSQPVTYFRQSNVAQASRYQLVRGSTSVFQQNLYAAGAPGSDTFAYMNMFQGLTFLDSPTSATSVTYKTQLQFVTTTANGAALVAQLTNFSSSMTLLEVSA